MDKNKYVLLYRYLLARIYFGFYPKGTALPSIYRLSEMFGVSTITSREAIRLLKEKGFVAGSQGKRTTVIFDGVNSGKPPLNIFAEKETLQDLFQSLYLLVPSVFYQSYLLCSKKELDQLSVILDRFDDVMGEQTLHYLFYLVSRLNNPLINDLYADTLLYSYPAHLLRFFNEPGWENTFKEVEFVSRKMIDLRKKGEEEGLWNLLHEAYLGYDPEYASGESPKDLKKFYSWGKPDICHSIARELIYRIYCETYPVGSFLPSPKMLSQEFSAATITIRRAIGLLNKLGVTESINGKGTKVLSVDEGKGKIRWSDPSVRKSLMTYFYALHIFSISCRSVANVLFPQISKERLAFLRKQILAAKESGYTEAVSGICFSILLENSHLFALREIYLRLEDILLWGYPLVFIEPRLQMDDYVDMLVDGIDSADGQIFACGLEQVVRAIFVSSRKKIISVGIDAAKNVELPELPPLLSILSVTGMSASRKQKTNCL